MYPTPLNPIPYSLYPEAHGGVSCLLKFNLNLFPFLSVLKLWQAIEPTPTELADMRARICIGMKRYFYRKNIEGLLSNSVRGRLI